MYNILMIMSYIIKDKQIDSYLSKFTLTDLIVIIFLISLLTFLTLRAIIEEFATYRHCFNSRNNRIPHTLLLKLYWHIIYNLI